MIYNYDHEYVPNNTHVSKVNPHCQLKLNL